AFVDSTAEKKRSAGWGFAGLVIVLSAGFAFAYVNGFFINKPQSNEIVEVTGAVENDLNHSASDIEQTVLHSNENLNIVDESSTDISVEEIASVTTVVDEAENEDFAKANYIDTPEAFELFLRLHPDGI